MLRTFFKLGLVLALGLLCSSAEAQFNTLFVTSAAGTTGCKMQFGGTATMIFSSSAGTMRFPATC